MRLSIKGRYGVRALFDIAFYNDGGSSQIREIAERQLIPPRFLEQIFQDLKRAGILGSKRGPRGGYHLAKPPTEIRVGDVIRAVEGPALVLHEEVRGRRPSLDPTAAVFEDIVRAVERCFDSVTIADVCERGISLGVRKTARERANYAI